MSKKAVKEYVVRNTGEVLREDELLIINNESSNDNNFGNFQNSNKIIYDLGGNYFHMLFNRILEKNFKENYAIRFLKLCTYMNYDNILVEGNTSGQRKVREKDLKRILRLSDKETRNTKKYLLENKLIAIDNDCVISINKEYCMKGNIKGSPEVVRVFQNGFGELYNQVSARQHKILFNFIRCLPYLNKDFNILCKNPLENDKTLIKPLSFGEVGKKFGLDTIQTSKLKAKLFRLRIKNKKVVAEWIDDNKRMIIINPIIFWKSNKNTISDVSKIFDI
ncbi:hypothetical protein GCM10008916_08850 [Clostridium nitritogenes]|uniref:Uncharacterized protein n=1 Tax=Clostridium nitritogenes TaxID=83340 RepID=A0ABN1LJT2_9CLOT